MPITSYLQNKLLDAVLANVAYTTPETVYLSLHSTLGNADTAGTELSGNGYSRQSVVFANAASGTSTTTANVVFTANGGPWDRFVSSELYDASTGGNRLVFGPIVPKTLADGESTTFKTGDINITLS